MRYKVTLVALIISGVISLSALARSHGSPSSLQATTEDAHGLLAEADRLSWLFNWNAAGPLYKRAEQLFVEAGDERNAFYAKIGRLRAEGETMSWRDLSELLAYPYRGDKLKDDATSEGRKKYREALLAYVNKEFKKPFFWFKR